MEPKDEDILEWTFYGYELSSDDSEFPNWFKHEWQKIACLTGYTMFDTGLVLENEEVIKEVRSKL